MSSDGTFATVVAASMLLFLGMIVAFFGYRLFWIILPIWGFFFGLAIGAQGVQALFGDGFLSTGLSWVVAFFMGLLFAGLSYLFWFIAVALVGGYIGYGLVVGLFGLFSVELGPLVWILGVAAGVIFAVATLMLNLQKYVVIIGSAMLGGAAIVGTILTVLNQVDPSVMADHPVKVVTDAGFGWALLFLGVAVVGALYQLASTRYYEIERYNRWTEYNTVDGGVAAT
ncbi:MAG: DUF4203 domain-containing protein [Actinomycetota bacterium]